MKHFILTITFSLSITSIFSQTTIEEVKQLADEGKYNIALEKTYDLVKADSLNAHLWYELGELQSLNSKYNEAAISFARALKIGNTSKKTYFALADSYSKSGRKGRAIETYKAILKDDPKNIAALSNLAKIYFTNRKDLAYSQYENLFNLDTTNVSYLYMMIKCLSPRMEALKIFELLKKGYSIDSTNVNIASYLNRIYSDIGSYDSAMMVINSVIKLYPDAGFLYFRRGSTQAKKNYHFRSVPDFKKAIELGYKSDILINKLGKSLFMIKKYKESRDCFNELFSRQDTIDYQACMYMGNIYNELNKPDSALLFLNKAIEILTPDNLIMASISSSKAQTYRLKKDYHKQIEHIKVSNDYRAKRGFLMNYYLLQIANIYDEDLNNKKAALKYYTKYYNLVKDKAHFRGEQKEKLIARINRLKEDSHFEAN